MSIQLSQADIYGYAFVALFGFIVLRRAYVVVHGTPASTARLLGLPAFYVLLFVTFMTAVLYGAIGSSIAGPVSAAFGIDMALVVVGTFVAYGYASRHVHLYRDPGATDWSYRLNAVLPIIYVLLFFLRTGLEAAILGLTPFDVPSATQLAGVAPWTLYVLFAVDAMWGISTGFLVGRNVAVYEKWQRKLREGSSALPSDVATP